MMRSVETGHIAFLNTDGYFRRSYYASILPDRRAGGAGMPIPLTTFDPLASISIATPCTVSWGGMVGDDRSRFCRQCERQVFDLSRMTTAEATQLLASPDGRPCVRLYRRPDGRVLTADCLVGLRTRLWRGLRRRAAWAASLFAMLFLPACRTAWQGMRVPDHAEAVSKQPPSEAPGGVPSATQANNDVRESTEQPGNALAQFAGNGFNAWTISHRIEVPVGQKRLEESSDPQQDDR